jgi:dihydroflavonol-4-reductase
MSAALQPGDSVLVTGASGFLGSAVARALNRRGIRPRLLIRPSSPPGNLHDLDHEPAYGDLTDEASLTASAAGVRYLFHVAADYRLWAPDPSVILRVNLDGTAALMRQAMAEGVERIVYTSSVATLTGGRRHAPVDESAALNPAAAIGPYKRSKTLAERAVEDMMIREEGLPAVIVHPSTPIGPHDIRPTPTGRMILDAARGKIPAFVDTGLNFAHVDDIAEGHLMAFEHGRMANPISSAARTLSLRDFLAAIARRTGRRGATYQPAAPATLSAGHGVGGRGAASPARNPC